VTIDDQFKNKLNQLLASEVYSYPVDNVGANKIFNIIDNWVLNRVQYKKSKATIVEGDTFYVISTNISEENYNELIVDNYEGSFSTYYIKGAYKREYIRDFMIPMRKSIPKDELSLKSKEFVNKNGFLRVIEKMIMHK
jgi:hypothetical protein